MPSHRNRRIEMLVLGIETSGTRGSVALCRDEELVAEYVFEEGPRHARNIMVAVEEVLGRAAVAKSEIDAVAVSEGPGSFTGLRVGVTCAKTLAYLLGWQAVGVPSLEVMAQNVDPEKYGCAAISPLLDARRSFVYGTVFRWEGGRWTDTTGVMAGEPGQVLSRLPHGTLIFGSGVEAYHNVLVHAEGSVHELSLQVGPIGLAEGEAKHAAILGLRMLREGGGVPPMQLAPKYYRRTEAEEKQLGRK